MVKTLKLVFVRPVGDDVPVNEKDGKFGAQRPYGTHIGVDFSAYFDTVYACEDGCVVYSGTRDGSKIKPITGILSSSIIRQTRKKTSAIYIPCMLILTTSLLPKIRTSVKGK